MSDHTEFPCIACAWRYGFHCHYHRRDLEDGLYGCTNRLFDETDEGVRILKITYRLEYPGTRLDKILKKRMLHS